MKKITFLILCALCLTILAGCFESEESKARKREKETVDRLLAPGTIPRNF